MTQPTHTHKTQGGRFVMEREHTGSSALEGQRLTIYRDLDKDVTSATTLDDWHKNWRPLDTDDCTLCLGSGRDAIKGNKANPCGGCYGLGKVKANGEMPDDRWELADVALGIIQRQARIIESRDQVLAFPEVAEVLKARKERQQKEPPGWVQREQAWREGSGRGHGGRRQTGD